MLYPSGMVVARLAADGSGTLSYTKHYFAGSQRVSSKIGTTTNLGKFLQDWTLQSNGAATAPINVVLTSHNQLAKAEAAVLKVYTAFGITPPTLPAGNTAFLPEPAFNAGTTEKEQYFFHPDHLGSSNYITNFVGDVCQHMEYFAFGETFVEEHKNSNSSPYKFNGKELDDESGLYYYGARYYDPRISIWASVDPLAEKYAGWSPYNYCLQNPLNLIDPDGMKVKYAREDGQSRKEFRAARREFKERNKQLMKDSKEHRDNFNKLVDSKNTHTITFNRGKGSDGDKVKGEKIDRLNGNNSVLNVDLNQQGSDNEFVIGHGTRLAVDIDNGTSSPNEAPSINIKDDPKDTNQKIFDVRNNNSKFNEENACHTENIIRGQVSNSRGITVPLRQTYNLQVEFLTPFKREPAVKTVPINVIRNGYDYYKK